MPVPRRANPCDVFVVSRSRSDRSDTLESLGDSAHSVTLVVPTEQVDVYKTLAGRYGCRLVGCPHDGIARTREYCGRAAKTDRFLMLDDDLKFFRRTSPTDYRLRTPTELGDDVAGMLYAVSRALDRYAHVAVSAREGNNRLPYPGAECSRPLRALAYRTDEFLRCEHGRVRVMEDFDVTLQMIRRGLKNFVLSYWSQDQKQTQAAGGCSDYRTLELHEAEVRRFAVLHEGFVRLRDKKNKTGGAFGSRLEATIYWQRAWESSQQS